MIGLVTVMIILEVVIICVFIKPSLANNNSFKFIKKVGTNRSTIPLMYGKD